MADTVQIDLNNVSERLEELEKQTQCPITQINGQRIFGPPYDWRGEKPARGSEIFVGRLPRDLFEDRLYPILSTYGRVYKIRLMLEFSGVNRGFAFVTYSNPTEAKLAVENLNKFEIIPNHKILAFISIDNCRLFVANIPCTKTARDIFYSFKRIMDGLNAVILNPNSKGKQLNRGFAFLEFDCHKNALEVRKRFWPYNLKIWNRKLFIDWAIPHHLKAQCKQLLLKGLNTKTTSEDLANAIYARLRNVTLLGLKIRGAEAVITFKTRSNATEAYQKLRGLSIGGTSLSVSYKFPEDEPINDGKESGTSLFCPGQGTPKSTNINNYPSWIPIYAPLPPMYTYNNHSSYSKQWYQKCGVSQKPPSYPSTSVHGTAHFTPFAYNQIHYPYQQPWYSNVRVFQPQHFPTQFWYPSNYPILSLPPTRTNTHVVSDNKLPNSCTSELNNFSVTKVTEKFQECLKIRPQDQIKEETDTEDEIFDHNSTFT